MSVKVKIPSPLLKITKNQSEIDAEGNNVKEMFDNIEQNFPGMKERLFDENNTLRRFINVYINEEDIRFLDGENSTLKEGDAVSIVPAIAGGQ